MVASLNSGNFWHYANALKNGISSVWSNIKSGETPSALPGSGLANDILDNVTGRSQKEFAREQFEYNKQLNELQMQREDSTYQRTIADLQAAGLNPNLLLGGSAGALSSSAGSPVSGVMPSGKGGLSDLIGLFNMVQAAKETDARVDNLEAGAAAYQTKATNTGIDNQMKQIELSKYDLMVAARLLKLNNESAREQGAALLSNTLANLYGQEFAGHEADGTYRNIPMVSESTSGGALGIKGSHSSTHPYSSSGNKTPAAVNQWNSFSEQEKNNVTGFENYARNLGYDFNLIRSSSIIQDMRRRASKASSRDWPSLLDDYKELF